MFSGLFKDGRSNRSIRLGAVTVAALVVFAGQAAAADRGGNRGGGGQSGGSRNNMVHPIVNGGSGHYGGGGGNNSHGNYNNNHNNGGSHNSFSLSIGTGWCGTGWSSSYNYSSGRYYNSCGPRYGYGYSYCAPRPYCPVVVAPCAPVYTPVVVDTYCPPRVSTVVVSSPVVVERPVYVERQVVVERPVTVEKQVVVEKVVERPVLAQAAPVAPQAGTYRDRELGDAYLRIGDMDNATRVYGRYLSAWDKDGTATRNMGMAQIASGHPQEGFRNVITGYKLESNLIDRPLRIQDVGGAAGYTQLLDQATRSADGLNLPDGWLTVAMLQQMNGQKDAAVAALQKARDAGLDKDTLDSFTLAIAK